MLQFRLKKYLLRHHIKEFEFCYESQKAIPPLSIF